MFLKKRDHARIMAGLRARSGAKNEEDSGYSEEEEGELRIVEVEEGDAVETCFICNRPGVYGKSEEYEGEVVRYCCQEHQDLHQGPNSVLSRHLYLHMHSMSYMCKIEN